MKTVLLVKRDGSRNFLGLVPSDFDTQSWADSRGEAFRLLGVTKVEEQDVSAQARAEHDGCMHGRYCQKHGGFHEE